MSFKKHDHEVHDKHEKDLEKDLENDEQDQDLKETRLERGLKVSAPTPDPLDANGDPIPLAVVTHTAPPKYNVVGSLKQQIYHISGASGDTFDIGLTSIKKINADAPITGFTLTPLTLGRNRITIAASGPYTNAGVEVLGN